MPEHILNKPGKLTAAEFEKMTLHAPIGAEILTSTDFPYPVVPIVRRHHENWDGTGYPDGIRGMRIPVGARILSVVDCFDALTSDRPYRSRMTQVLPCSSMGLFVATGHVERFSLRGDGVNGFTTEERSERRRTDAVELRRPADRSRRRPNGRRAATRAWHNSKHQRTHGVL